MAGWHRWAGVNINKVLFHAHLGSLICPSQDISLTDLTSVMRGWNQQLPDNAERFDKYFLSVLGSEGFNSGTHRWDVDVGDSADWTLGVLPGSGNRSSVVSVLQGLWRIWFNEGGYQRLFYFPLSVWEVKKKLQRIRVSLDWKEEKLILTLTHNTPSLRRCFHVFPSSNSQINVICLRFQTLKVIHASIHLWSVVYSLPSSTGHLLLIHREAV